MTMTERVRESRTSKTDKGGQELKERDKPRFASSDSGEGEREIVRGKGPRERSNGQDGQETEMCPKALWVVGRPSAFSRRGRGHGRAVRDHTAGRSFDTGSAGRLGAAGSTAASVAVWASAWRGAAGASAAAEAGRVLVRRVGGVALVGKVPLEERVVVVTRGSLEHGRCAGLACVGLLAGADAAPDEEAEECDEEDATPGSDGDDGGLAERHVRLEAAGGLEGGCCVARAGGGAGGARSGAGEVLAVGGVDRLAAEAEGAGDDDLAVTDGDGERAVGADGHGPLGGVDGAGLTVAGLLVADAVPNDVGGGLDAVGREHREPDGAACQARKAEDKVLVGGVAAVRVVGLGVDHDDGAERVASVDGKGVEAVGVGAGLVAERDLCDPGVAGGADDLGPGGPGVVGGTYVRALAVHVVGLPGSGDRVLGHVHLHCADLDAGSEEEEVEGPESVCKGLADALETVGADAAHLAEVVGLAGDEGLLDLTGPFAELADGGGKVEEDGEGELVVGDVDVVVVVVLVPACDVDAVVGGDAGVDEVGDAERLSVLGGGGCGGGYLKVIGVDAPRLEHLVVDGFCAAGPLVAKVVYGPVLGAVAEVDVEVWLVADFEADDLGAVWVGADVLKGCLRLCDDAVEGVCAGVGEVESVVVRGPRVAGTGWVCVLLEGGACDGIVVEHGIACIAAEADVRRCAGVVCEVGEEVVGELVGGGGTGVDDEVRGFDTEADVGRADCD
ncbi:hypothetical protein L1887_45967 [Cichorium endivia]|nr:hypothetical protein L1887_45967 [Cichorium endivia]